MASHVIETKHALWYIRDLKEHNQSLRRAGEHDLANARDLRLDAVRDELLAWNGAGSWYRFWNRTHPIRDAIDAIQAD